MNPSALRYALARMAADNGQSLRADLTAVVCTRNRGASIVPTISTLLANDHPSFELLVIDQSTSDDTEEAIRPFFDDRRLRYIRSAEQGKGRALNQALGEATGAIMAITDDDVTVPSDWLALMEAAFDGRPAVAVAFCNVVAGPHDPSAGFVPDYVRTGTIEVTTMRAKCRARGIGAGVAVRPEAIRDMGGFDVLLGPGGPMGSTDDRDLAVRALLAGWHVLETDRVEVVHHGFRTWLEGRQLTRRDWVGMGSSLAKPMRMGRLNVTIVVLWEGIVMAILQPIGETIRTRRPSGLKQGWYFWRGFVMGWRHPIDRESMCFVADSDVSET